jgi:hypothetical protein
MGHRIHIHRPAAALTNRPRRPTSIARRAVDLAHDDLTSPADATEHLLRLAGGCRAPLVDALDILRGSEQLELGRGADVECARLLVRAAIESLDASAG